MYTSHPASQKKPRSPQRTSFCDRQRRGQPAQSLRSLRPGGLGSNEPVPSHAPLLYWPMAGVGGARLLVNAGPRVGPGPGAPRSGACALGAPPARLRAPLGGSARPRGAGGRRWRCRRAPGPAPRRGRSPAFAAPSAASGTSPANRTCCRGRMAPPPSCKVRA